MAKLALYKAPGKIGNALIRWWTHSQYSHCELVVDGWCYSSSIMDGGVRRKQIEIDPEHWDLIDIPAHLEPKILAHFDATAGQPYGWIDLLRSQIFNTASDDPEAAFCSEWCAEALGLPNPVTFSPKTLGDIACYLIGGAWPLDQFDQPQPSHANT